MQPPKRVRQGSVLEIDAATRRSLELAQTQTGERRGSLLATIDRTVTGAGARLLADRLNQPITDVARIVRRQDDVAFFFERPDARADLRRMLKSCPDVARALSRLGLGRGGPRDLVAIRETLAAVPALRELLRAASPDGSLPEGLMRCYAGLGEHAALVERLTRALAEDPPLLARDGGVIAKHYAPELDELRELRDDSRRLIAALQARYAAESGVSALKIKYNNVLGYFVEVAQKHGVV